MDFQSIDLFLANLVALYAKYPGLGVATLFGIVLVLSLIGGIVDVVTGAQDRKEAAEQEEHDAKLGIERKPRRRRVKVDPVDAAHLSLLSGFLDCAMSTKDETVARTLFELAGLTDRIMRRIKSREPRTLGANEKRFIEHEAPDTLNIAKEYVKQARGASSERLLEALRRTGGALAEFREGFASYLAKFEGTDGERLEVLAETRRRVAAFTKPEMLPAPDEGHILPPIVTGKKEPVARS
ncbi:MAG TPA: hypothetical protein VLB83_00830 [Candidatus Paceibacterota bacterium]|nr:hypothetical protein [Candidatus Paceibacterota bacterium]